VLKDAWQLGGDSSVINNPFRAVGSTPSYICLPHMWGSAGGDCLIPHFSWHLTGLEKY
jgi:hypothetical protein